MLYDPRKELTRELDIVPWRDVTSFFGDTEVQECLSREARAAAARDFLWSRTRTRVTKCASVRAVVAGPGKERPGKRRAGHNNKEMAAVSYETR